MINISVDKIPMIYNTTDMIVARFDAINPLGISYLASSSSSK